MWLGDLVRFLRSVTHRIHRPLSSEPDSTSRTRKNGSVGCRAPPFGELFDTFGTPRHTTRPNFTRLSTLCVPWTTAGRGYSPTSYRLAHPVPHVGRRYNHQSGSAAHRSVQFGQEWPSPHGLLRDLHLSTTNRRRSTSWNSLPSIRKNSSGD